ncbi:MAG: sugar transferase, partial [Planctomycetota bacterium]|nr:sugar transferase [Planctomycetota bacterium]
MLAVVLLVLLFPLIGILMAIVRLTSSGPGLFRQARTGKNQKSFTMYKIRTMAENAEAKSGPIWARVSDSRVTAVGHVLRKLHLDELPQLFNVLKGEMSLVGPRPERPEFIDMLAEQISGYKNRLAEKPGITGLAQLNLPPDSDLKSVRYKLVLDLEYLRQASFFLDIRIILCTALRGVKLPERMSLRFFGLHRSISNEQLERHKPPVEKPATAG